jgi:hypothetical protein
MLKLTLTTLALASAPTVPTLAAEMKCDEVTMQSMTNR